MCELHRHARSETFSPRRHSLVLGTLSLTFPSYLLVFPSRLSSVRLYFPVSDLHHPSIASSEVQLVNLAAYSCSFSLSCFLFPFSSFLLVLPCYLPPHRDCYDLLSHFLLSFRFFNVFPDISVLFFMKLLFRLYQ